MSRVRGDIPGFYGGISQQSPEQRRENQVEDMLNCIPSVAEGTYKRPGTVYEGDVTAYTGNYKFVKTKMSTKRKRYDIFLRDSPEPVQIIDEEGINCTITYVDNEAKTYLDTVDPEIDFAVLTVFDTVFVANRSKVPAMEPDLVTYNIPVAHCQYPSEGDVTTDNPIQEEFDFNGEVYNVNTSADVPSKESLVDLWADGATNSSHTIIIKVQGTEEDQANRSGYYLKADHGDTAFYECAAPGIEYKMNPATMPIRIKRTGTTTFDIESIDWAERVVGDDKSNPLPSFIGKNIIDLRFFKNRLGFLLNDGIVLSKTLEYFDFFASSGIEMLDDDPIDLTSSGKATGDMFYLETAYDKLTIFGNFQQYALYSGENSGILKATNTVLDSTTGYTCPQYGQAVAMGSSMYFPEINGNYLNIREYIMQPGVSVEDAANITKHVPRLIPHEKDAVIKLFGFPESERLLVHTTATPKVLYLYEYTWEGNTKAQSAWCKLTFDRDIKSITEESGEMTFVTAYADKYLKESLRFSETNALDTIDIALLDRRVLATNPTYNIDFDRTEWDLPLSFIDPDASGIQMSTGFRHDGLISADGTKFRLYGDQTSLGELVVGKPFNAYIKLTKWYLRPTSKPAMLSPHLVCENLLFSFKDTGYFEVVVEAQGRPTKSQEFSGTYIGRSVLGQRELHTGYHMFSIKSKPLYSDIVIQNNSHLPMKLQMGEYRGTVPNRYKSM